MVGLRNHAFLLHALDQGGGAIVAVKLPRIRNDRAGDLGHINSLRGVVKGDGAGGGDRERRRPNNNRKA